MTGQLFTHYFLTDGIGATPEWQASAADPETFTAFPGIRPPALRGPRPCRRPQRGGHRAGSHPAGAGAARVGGLPPPAGHGAQ